MFDKFFQLIQNIQMDLIILMIDKFYDKIISNFVNI
jgi:hypothetical protein